MSGQTVRSFTITALGCMMSLHAQAYTIDDATNGTATYWGADHHGYGDVIAAATDRRFDISGADVKLVGGVLTVDIWTNFAGDAGVFPSLTRNKKGIGYGDLLLSAAWTPVGSDVHHATDNALRAGTTFWKYGLSLDDRWNNSGGTVRLYELDEDTNDGNLLLTGDFMSGGVYRNGQAVAVDTSKASDTSRTGTWLVDGSNNKISFSINLNGTGLSKWQTLALHWGATCQNDVIEGLYEIPVPPSQVPEPGSLALIGLALAGLGAFRRRNKS